MQRIAITFPISGCRCGSCRLWRGQGQTEFLPSGNRELGGNREGGPDREIKPELAPQAGLWSPCGLVQRPGLEYELRPTEKFD